MATQEIQHEKKVRSDLNIFYGIILQLTLLYFILFFRISCNDYTLFNYSYAEHKNVAYELFEPHDIDYALVCSEELVGAVICSWEDLQQSASVCSPVEGWFTCTDGQGHDGGRELRLRIQLLTTPIDGADEEPLFDPKEDLHRVYSDVFRSLTGPELLASSVSSEAVDWLLSQLRWRCGVGDAWNHLLVLAPGVNLVTPHGLSHDAALEVANNRWLIRRKHALECSASNIVLRS